MEWADIEIQRTIAAFDVLSQVEKSCMKKRIQSLSLILVACIALSGCSHTTKDTYELCNRGEFNFKRAITGESVDFRFLADVRNDDQPIDANAFWVRIRTWNVGRRYYIYDHRRNGYYWENGSESIPIYYTTAKAYLELENGQVVMANPGIFHSSPSWQYNPGPLMSKAVVDLNSDAVQMQTKNGSGSMFGVVYIKFNIKPPQPDAKWKLHLGSIQINNEDIALPVQYLCERKGQTNRVRWNFNP